jgi:RNA polymerase sigma-70 factor, ECF subfamily
MADGPEHGLEQIDRIEGLDDCIQFHAARADLLRRLGRGDEAATAYERALAVAPAGPERLYLARRLTALRTP